MHIAISASRALRRAAGSHELVCLISERCVNAPYVWKSHILNFYRKPCVHAVLGPVGSVHVDALIAAQASGAGLATSWHVISPSEIQILPSFVFVMQSRRDSRIASKADIDKP